jgi:deazaflavin-dependent oxidoreductase (nitroreductase family)
MSKSLIDAPPGKALRLALRLPIGLYRLHLGPLLGNRFLMLTHTGRKSGQPRRTVIEVVQHDKQTGTYYVVSGWGKKSDWYRNIRKTPAVTVQVGGRAFQSQTEFIPLEKAVGVLETYARDHPTAFRELSSLFFGERLQPGSEAPRRLAEKMPMVAFHPEGETKNKTQKRS